MKKLYLFVAAAWLLATGPLCAQSTASVAPYSDSLRLKLDNVFAPLIKAFHSKHRHIEE